MYKEFDSVEALNKEAEELLKAGNEKEIINLAINQGIDEDEARDYIDGIVDTFATANMAAMGKLSIKEKELKIEGILKDWMNTIRRVVLEDKDIAEKVYRKSVEGCLAEMLAYSFENKVKVPDAIASVTTVTINGKKEKMRTPVYMGVPNSTDARQIVQKYYRMA